jgi:hypothetical protein
MNKLKINSAEIYFSYFFKHKTGLNSDAVCTPSGTTYSSACQVIKLQIWLDE